MIDCMGQWPQWPGREAAQPGVEERQRIARGLEDLRPLQALQVERLAAEHPLEVERAAIGGIRDGDVLRPVQQAPDEPCPGDRVRGGVLHHEAPGDHPLEAPTMQQQRLREGADKAVDRAICRQVDERPHAPVIGRMAEIKVAHMLD